jgi:hypothetical protein
MMDSRYTLRRDAGTDFEPALILDTHAGPTFIEHARPAEGEG